MFDGALTNNEREEVEHLIPDEDLGSMLNEARKILERKPTRYDYRTGYKGGPRNIDPEDLKEAAVELTAARLVYEEMSDRALEASMLLWEKMDEMLNDGIPVEFVAKHSGYKYRSSVYRVIKQLPKLKESLNKAREIAKLTQEKARQ